MSDNWHDWGMEFIKKIDTAVMEPGNEEVKENWVEGDFDSCEEWIKDNFPELTEEQLEWLRDFLSEI